MTLRSPFAEFCRLAARGGLVAVTETVAADLLTPLSAYLRIAQGEERSFLLESVEGGEQLARYSFLGAAPEMVVRSRHGVTTIEDSTGIRQVPGTTVDVLRQEFARGTLSAAEGTAPMAGGCVGYLGYAAARWFDPAMQAVEGEGDDACFLIFRTVLAFDHARQQIQIRTLAEVEANAADSALRQAYDAAAARNQEIVNKLSVAMDLPLRQGVAPDAGEVEFESNFERAEFERAVAEGKELIFAGECFQIVLSQRFRRRTTADAVALYRALRATNPSPYMFLLDFGAAAGGGRRALIGASPEMLVRCRQRELTYRPIAGTRPRGRSSSPTRRSAPST
jgi:anthranilate synthase component 1